MSYMSQMSYMSYMDTNNSGLVAVKINPLVTVLQRLRRVLRYNVLQHNESLHRKMQMNRSKSALCVFLCGLYRCLLFCGGPKFPTRAETAKKLSLE